MTREPAITDYPVWDALVPPSGHGLSHSRAVRAQGHRVLFADGSELLDATSGLWNVNLGYGNRAIADAIAGALADASYLTLFRYGNDYAASAARALLDVAGRDRYARVIFSTSGGAANDAAMKLARHYAHLRKEPRRLVVGLRDSYHGQTFGGFSLTGEDLRQPMYGVDTSLVRHVDAREPGELAALLKEAGDQVAAVVVEPVMGTGARELPQEMVSALLELRAAHGFLLVCDEVATGFGRTGPMFASSTWPQPPDILITSKGLTNGTCAAAAVLVSAAVYDEFDRADATFIHGETQAGTPPTCAAILATLDQFDELDALAGGGRNAKLINTGLHAIQRRIELVHEVSGRGNFRALHLRAPHGASFWQPHVSRVIRAIRAHGVLVHPGPSAVQLVPALTFREEEISEMLAGVEAGLAQFAAERAARQRRHPGEAPSSDRLAHARDPGRRTAGDLRELPAD